MDNIKFHPASNIGVSFDSVSDIAIGFDPAAALDINIPLDRTLGPELVDQSAWYTVVYWDWNTAANWSQSGTTFVSDGNSGNNARNNLWTIGKSYQVTVTIIRNSGTFIPCYDAINAPTGLIASGTYTYEYTTTKDEMWIRSVSFDGSITAMSIKEIL